jgi:hypothetical protein
VVKKQYSLSKQEQERHIEEFEVVVPPHTKAIIVLEWKRIWQHGKIIFSNPNNMQVEVPFAVAVGITFNQIQADEGVTS